MPQNGTGRAAFGGVPDPRREILPAGDDPPVIRAEVCAAHGSLKPSRRPDQPPRGCIIYVRLLVVACSDKQTAVWTEHCGVQPLLVLNSRENFPARYGIANPSGVQFTGQNPLTVRENCTPQNVPICFSGEKG